MRISEELRRPWSEFPYLVAFYALCGGVGTIGLTILHVKFPDTTASPLLETPDKEYVPPIIPQVLPEGTSEQLISALPKGSHWTPDNANQWNKAVSRLDSSQNFDYPTLSVVKSSNKNFLSSVYTLPIMDQSGKVIGILDSEQLKLVKEDADQKYILARASDTNGELSEWSTTFFSKDMLLKFKVGAYKPDVLQDDRTDKLNAADARKVSKGTWYFLLDTAR